jgi:hypothetical protein
MIGTVSNQDESADTFSMRLSIDAENEAFVRFDDPQRAVALARERLAAEAEMLARGMVRQVAYGLADTLVDDAQIGVVRDPSEHTRATIIVSSAVQDDRLLLVAKALLRADEKVIPHAETRRVLLAWLDRRVRLHTDNHTYWRRHEYQVINVRSYGFDNIRLYTASARPTLVAGVGIAAVVVLPANRVPPPDG